MKKIAVKHEIGLKRLAVFFLFLGASVIFTYVFYISGRLVIDSDGSFHFSRTEEIYQNLRTGSWATFIATHTFHSSGVASFLFYPSVFSYPWALLRFIVDPIHAFYLWYGLMMLLTLCIAYYSMVNFSKNRLRAIYFALFIRSRLIISIWE